MCANVYKRITSPTREPALACDRCDEEITLRELNAKLVAGFLPKTDYETRGNSKVFMNIPPDWKLALRAKPREKESGRSKSQKNVSRPLIKI